MIDSDLDVMSREELISRVKKLRGGIRAHRDSSGHELCWHHPALWGCCRSGRIPFPRFLRGRSSFAAAFVTGSRSMSRLATRHEPTKSTQGDLAVSRVAHLAPLAARRLAR